MPKECTEVLTWFHVMKYINYINSANINISHLSVIRSLSKWYNASSVLFQPIIIITPLITKICIIYSLRRQTVGMCLWSTGFSSGYKPYLKTNKCAGHYTSRDYMGLLRPEIVLRAGLQAPDHIHAIVFLKFKTRLLLQQYSSQGGRFQIRHLSHL